MFKIYQIDPNKDTNKVMFFPYRFLKEFNFSIYKEVWSGHEFNNSDELDEIFYMFNCNHPKDFKGHSLSVSDIVQIVGSDEGSNGYYYCDSFGWEKLDIK